jgi:hypothetical protein
MAPFDNFVSVGELMRELHVRRVPQIEFLRAVGIKPSWSERNSRGESLYILRSEADQLRQRAQVARLAGHGRGWWSQSCRHKTTLASESQLFQIEEPERPVGVTPMHDVSVLASTAPAIPTPRNPRRRREKPRLTLWGRVKKSFSILLGVAA